MAGGRPTDYDPEFAKQAAKLCKLGATNNDLADFFEVSVRTIIRWTIAEPKFCHSLKLGKAAADNRVEQSLYHRAIGYTHESLKIFNNQGEIIEVPFKEHYPPDTTAAIFWLKNRKSKEWRDTSQVRHDFDLTKAVEADELVMNADEPGPQAPVL